MSAMPGLRRAHESMTSVDPRVHPLAAFDIPLFGWESLQFGFQSQQYRLRQAVRQMKGHMLRHLGTFKVRQISTAVHTVPELRERHSHEVTWNAILLNGSLPANREIGVPGIVLRVVH